MNVYLCFLVCFHFHNFRVTTSVEFLDLPKVCSSSELKTFLLSMCIDAPESTTNSRSSVDFEANACILLASIEEKRSFVSILELVCKTVSPNPMLLCGRTFLGARCPHVIFLRILARKDCAHKVYTLGQLLAMDPFFPEFFFRATCPWRI